MNANVTTNAATAVSDTLPRVTVPATDAGETMPYERRWYWHYKKLESAHECLVANFMEPGGWGGSVRETTERLRASVGRGTSQFKGVTKPKKTGTAWTARLVLEKVLVFRGYYRTEWEAALAYDKAVIEFIGGSAFTNFSQGDIPPTAEQQSNLVYFQEMALD